HLDDLPRLIKTKRLLEQVDIVHARAPIIEDQKPGRQPADPDATHSERGGAAKRGRHQVQEAQRERSAPRSQMRILVTSSYYWPELTGNAPYVTGMAEHYASLGHEVVVTTIFPHYPDWKPLTPRHVALTERHQGVEVRR